MRFSDLGSVFLLSAEFFYFVYLYYFCLQLHLLFATVAAAEVYCIHLRAGSKRASKLPEFPEMIQGVNNNREETEFPK
jgi:hypothetical protein